MSTLRTHFTFRVDTWTPDGESIVEHVAGVEDYQVALATYRAACERWPGYLRRRGKGKSSRNHTLAGRNFVSRHSLTYAHGTFLRFI